MKIAVKNVILLLSLTLLSSAAMAKPGFGLYIETGTGSGDGEVDNELNDGDYDSENSLSGLGIVLDTSVDDRRSFNYRFNFGYVGMDQEWELENHRHSDTELELTGLNFRHTFGIALVRTELIRLWLGPNLQFQYLNGDATSTLNNPFGGNGPTVKGDAYLFGIGLGITMGLNFNLGPTTLSMSLGATQTTYGGEIEYKSSFDDDTADFDGHEMQILGNFSLLF